MTRVLDVGANDGYFIFGCAAAFRRFGQGRGDCGVDAAEHSIAMLQESVQNQPSRVTEITMQSMVGREIRSGTTTLDAVRWRTGDPGDRTNISVKIDVEGAELDVLIDARSWLTPANDFLIEVRKCRC